MFMLIIASILNTWQIFYQDTCTYVYIWTPCEYMYGNITYTTTRLPVKVIYK